MSLSFHRMDRVIRHRGCSVPTFLYGTAWKENETEALTRLALEAGFRGIDTANQRRHYHEAGAGEAVRAVLAEGRLKRSGLFLQTKYTFAQFQDDRLPYDPKADITAQVNQSFQCSLEHLHTDYLDSYLLHGPASSVGLSEADWEAWRAMEALQKSGKAKLIGVSNFSFKQLKALIEKADVRPAFVQNRCFARTHWDAEVRRLCEAHDILYQGFSLLTANSRELDRPGIDDISTQLRCTRAQLVFRFALQSGIIPLTGTSDENHMMDDLAAYDMTLDAVDMRTIEESAF